MAVKKRAPRSKPTKRVDRRKTTSTRITPETRAQLEEAAGQSGRSLAQEIEFRLEQSFRDEEARDREWGGKKLHGIFRMMIGALEIIEENRGNSCGTDWGTFLAVHQAWTILQFSNLAPTERQSLPSYLESIGGPPTDFEMPPRPTPPEHPVPVEALSDQRPSSKEIAKYLRERQTYEEEYERWVREVDDLQDKWKLVTRHFEAMESLGTKTVFEMFPAEAQD